MIYENGNKRYQDETFYFDGHNSTIVLENGGGKTVWVQAALQAVLPHTEVAGRRAYETFLLSEGCAHIGIEWILQDKPRRYLVTAVTLYEQSQRLQSYRYVYEYGSGDTNSLENIPYVVEVESGAKRPTDKVEIGEYYSKMAKNHMNAKVFGTIEQYHEYIAQYHIIDAEWKKIAQINGAEGGVGKFFEECKTTSTLVERLLIPVVEDAISGGGAENFVDAFEKQREHIKRFKQLKHQINECTDILEKVQGFTKSFEKWNKEQKLFELLKGKAKAVFDIINQEYEQKNKEYKDILEEEVSLAKEIEHLDYKTQSYKLLQLENQVNEKQQKYNHALENHEKIETQRKMVSHRLASLQYARIQQGIEDCYREEETIKKSIERLSQDDVAAHIEEQLEENSQYLSGYYKNAIEEIETEIKQLENQKIRKKEELEKDKKEKSSDENQRSLLEKDKIANETRITDSRQELERLTSQILDMPQHETVESKRLKLQKRTQEIEKQTRESYDKLNLLEKERVIIAQNKEELIESLDKVKENLFKEQNNLDNLENSHEELLHKVHASNEKWAYIDSIYNNYSMLISSIETQIETSRIEYNKAMEIERISFRWIDEYGKSDFFIADSKLLSWIEEWKREFTLLVTGSEYIQGSEESSFPYWPITLITTEKEASKLRGYIEENREYISHPVWIMTDYEAGQYLNKEELNESELIFPLLWESNIQQAEFRQWKERLEKEAKISQDNRQISQAKYEAWKSLKQETISFLVKYPLELYQSLRDYIYEHKQQKNQMEKHLDSIYRREEQIILEEKDLISQKVELEREYTHIETIMEKIRTFLRIASEVEAYKKELEELVYPRLKTIQSRISILNRNIDDLTEQIEELKFLLNQKIRNRDTILDDVIYKEIKSYSPKYSSYSKDILISERENLKNERQKRQKGRRELEEGLNRIKKERSEKEEALENQLNQYPTLERTIRFLEEHGQEIKILIEKTRDLTQREKEANKEKEICKTQYDESNGLYKTRKEEFFAVYSETYKWAIPLTAIDRELTKESQNLKEKTKYIQEQLSRISLELLETKKSKEILEMKNERFEYLKDEITLAQLTQNEKLDLVYQKIKKIDEIIKKLEQTESIVKIKANELETQKQNFVQFCKSNITDIRLREMTLRGIEKLTQYEQVAQWEENLFNRITRTQRVAEDDLKTHDEELQLFIEFIHSYVQQVAEGLREIHRKTRVKIDDKWKEVYTIQVPEWEKLRGKEEIQEYILWIIGQLESGTYPGETHRKQIEKWLSVKQLLGIVTQDKKITVRCRKLTNQNTIAAMASSWESSNKWSGGEKWSKNMILFLGLLNFIAEKTGHVIEGQKRNRAVILDNPFGQASSDHVLNPVFFVAEQLGFKIITLTALAEGSFIRKYFPVVYSCRLRNAVDGTHIMAKELQIQRALFKDEELPSITRLETQEQLTLLGT